ncbi:hypothetical protein L0657_19470 [Dyadobacter sp. CY345]|uniref:DUF6934 family protein n=1 Tax=Dyadobacter sp. CY345 TaxID=2909335 RepID=UPI001F1BDAAF|nr:hypothetical protein [Dyadobacter sp. CY345]MCF2446146.1 hypothetical protein [Dyadobacter sp. CY345]
MNVKGYLLLKDHDPFVYQFISDGPKGKIKKIIQFQAIDLENNLYNLAFGDWNELTEQMDDLVVSNNQDKQKVLATVALAVKDFIEDYPNAIIFAKGSTNVRTRVYQIGISLFLEEITYTYQILGYVDNRWGFFEKGINYESFLLSKK